MGKQLYRVQVEGLPGLYAVLKKDQIIEGSRLRAAGHNVSELTQRGDVALYEEEEVVFPGAKESEEKGTKKAGKK